MSGLPQWGPEKSQASSAGEQKGEEQWWPVTGGGGRASVPAAEPGEPAPRPHPPDTPHTHLQSSASPAGGAEGAWRQRCGAPRPHPQHGVGGKAPPGVASWRLLPLEKGPGLGSRVVEDVDAVTFPWGVTARRRGKSSGRASSRAPAPHTLPEAQPREPHCAGCFQQGAVPPLLLRAGPGGQEDKSKQTAWLSVPSSGTRKADSSTGLGQGGLSGRIFGVIVLSVWSPHRLENVGPEPRDCALSEHWGHGGNLTNIRREESRPVEGSGISAASRFPVTILGTRRQMFSS